MIYIHSPHDLNAKAADIESVEFIRDIKNKVPFPFSVEQLEPTIEHYFLSDTDREAINAAITELPTVILHLKQLLDTKHTAFEPVTIGRAIHMVSDMQVPLQSNHNYSLEMSRSKGQLLREFTYVVNSIPALRDQAKKIEHNTRLNAVFEKILRDKDFRFNDQGMISDPQVSIISNLRESVQNGFLFKLSIEDDIKKRDFKYRKKELPINLVQMNDAVIAKLSILEKGVRRAYDNNLRMVEFAVLLYSHIKRVTS